MTFGKELIQSAKEALAIAEGRAEPAVMTPERFTKFDAAEYLKTDEAIAAFIADAETTGDKAYIEQAQQVAERARTKKAD